MPRAARSGEVELPELQSLGEAEDLERPAASLGQVLDRASAARRLQRVPGVDEEADTGGVDEDQAFAVQHEVVVGQRDQHVELRLQRRCGREVELAGYRKTPKQE